MNAFTVVVDYHDIFAQTAPLMRHRFDKWFVATDPAHYLDTKTAVDGLGMNIYATDAFTRDGADFNKWAALEELLDIGGRKGWVCILDADIVWPKDATIDVLPGQLFTPLRYMYPCVDRIPPESEWKRYPIHTNVAEWAGYTQIFHAKDPVLGPTPWHQTDWKMANGADSFFQKKWAKKDKIRPSWACLHLGPAGANWAGRVTAYADGTVPTDADAKTAKLREAMRLRGKIPGDQFFHEKLRGLGQ